MFAFSRIEKNQCAQLMHAYNFRPLHGIVGRIENFPALFVLLYFGLFVRKYGSNCTFKVFFKTPNVVLGFKPFLDLKILPMNKKLCRLYVLK
jgi:hypothetical protein